VVVSVMNPSAAEVTNMLGVPCVYVDVLLWMGPAATLACLRARYFAEGFTGVEQSVERWRDRLPSYCLRKSHRRSARGARASASCQVAGNRGGSGVSLLE
jgi:hypothetical protein